MYILLSNMKNNSARGEKIKVYNFNGQKIKEMEDSNDNIFFLDTYFDKKLSKQYIIAGNSRNVKSFDFEENKTYKVFSDSTKNSHCSAIIDDREEIIKLIESSFDGKVRIWNFHTGELLNRIKFGTIKLFGLCMNNDFLFVGCEDKTIRIIEMKTFTNYHEFNAHFKQVICLKIINLPEQGECLISQGLDDQIILWTYKNE